MEDYRHENDRISFNERRSIYLEMLDEFDRICEQNGLRYSLSSGTLLGAARHKGFIPWDDDADLMMPISDMQKLKNVLHSDIIEYCDVYTHKHYYHQSPNIAYRGTYSKLGIVAKSFGVNINLHPLVSVPKDPEEEREFFKRAEPMQACRLFLMKWRLRIVRHLPFVTIPFHDSIMRRYWEYLTQYSNQDTGRYYLIARSLSQRNDMLFDEDLFSQMTRIEFEGRTYSCIAKYDLYLKKRYGDYMTPPPENLRHGYHFNGYYWEKKTY